METPVSIIDHDTTSLTQYNCRIIPNGGNILLNLGMPKNRVFISGTIIVEVLPTIEEEENIPETDDQLEEIETDDQIEEIDPET